MNKSILDTLIVPKTIMIFSKTWCPYCDEAKSTLKKLNIKYNIIELDVQPLSNFDLKRLDKICGFDTVPKIFVGKLCIGGNSDMQDLIRNGEFNKLLTDEGIL